MCALIHWPKIGVVVVVSACSCRERFDFEEHFSSRRGPIVINLFPSCWEVECMDVWNNHMWCLSRIRVAADMVNILRRDIWVAYLVNQEIDRLSSGIYSSHFHNSMGD